MSTADMTTAKEQFAQFLIKGYALVKWLLKYLCGTAVKTFPQFYAAFTKRLDTLGIFASTLVEAGLQFCIIKQWRMAKHHMLDVMGFPKGTIAKVCHVKLRSA